MKFVDSYGKTVKHGDTVLIEQTYGRTIIDGKKAKVQWDERLGMFRFTIPGSYINDDFCSIHKFKRIKP